MSRSEVEDQQVADPVSRANGVNLKSKMAVLLIFLYIVFALITVALVSFDANTTQERTLSMAEIVLVLIFWPYFLIALIIHLNTGD